MNKNAFLKGVRVTHHYLGVFTAPAIMFFAFTGFLQMFSLHETSRGSSYTPPWIIVRLANIHKNATLPGPPKVRPPQAAPKPDKPDAPKSEPAPAPPPKALQHLPEKIFFGLVAIGLFTSTVTGLYMAWKYTRRKLVIVAVFLAGLVIPILLLPL
jgi:hypothetical protein